MKIVIEVNRDAALRTGRDEYGVSVVEIPASELTDEERAELARTVRRTGDPPADCDLTHGQNTDPAEATPETVRVEIEARIRSRREVREAEKKRAEEVRTKREAEIQRLLALPLGERIKQFRYTGSGGWSVIGHPSDPRLERWEEEAKAELRRVEAEAAERSKKTEAENEARKRQAREMVETWVREHGSERLRLIVEENLLDDSMAVYRDERLALELPGWEWDTDGANKDIRNPSIEALRALAAARKEVGEIVSGLELGYIWHEPDEEDYDGQGHGVVAVQAEFLGRDVRKIVE